MNGVFRIQFQSFNGLAVIGIDFLYDITGAVENVEGNVVDFLTVGHEDQLSQDLFHVDDHPSILVQLAAVSQAAVIVDRKGLLIRDEVAIGFINSDGVLFIGVNAGEQIFRVAGVGTDNLVAAVENAVFDRLDTFVLIHEDQLAGDLIEVDQNDIVIGCTVGVDRSVIVECEGLISRHVIAIGFGDMDRVADIRR